MRQQLPGVVREITDEIGENVDQLIDAKLMVIRYFVAHPELLNELFLIMGSKELRFMQNFGFYFGFPMGFVLVGVLQVLPYWWVLPVGGVDHRLGRQLHRHRDDLRAGAARRGGCRGARACCSSARTRSPSCTRR